MRTLNGYDINSLPIILDQVLPASAYKKIPAGGLDLTDVDANWQKRVFNKIFGMYGIGWGFSFDKQDIDIRFEEGKNRDVPYVRIVGKFWYAYSDKSGKIHHATFDVTGANNNQTGNEGYALKGAITNAIGFAGSMLGWQESIYLGARSHSNINGFAPGKFEVDIEEYKKEGQLPRDMPIINRVKKANIEPEPEPEPENSTDEIPSGEVAPSAKPNLAQSLGFETATDAKPEDKPLGPMKYLLCIKCGWAEPMNETPPACPQCGVVKEEAFTDCKSRPHMLECQKNTIERLRKEDAKQDAEADLKATAEKSKQLLDAIKEKTGNDRRSILSGLSEITGRNITSYSQASLDELEKFLAHLSEKTTAPENSGAGNDAAGKVMPGTRAELCQAILDTARDLKLGSPRQIITKIGEICGKTINTLTALNDPELEKVLRTLWEMEA